MAVADEKNIEVEKSKTKASKVVEKSEIESAEKAFVYIGPMLSAYGLANNKILQGTKEEIFKHYSSTIEKHPKVKQLIVPLSKLSESRRKVVTPGNVLHEYFKAVQLEAAGSKEA